MIKKESHTGCIDWTPDGKGFAILLKQNFETNILPLYFGKAKYASFMRRLKRCGFWRSSHAGAYYHATFHRDMTFEDDFSDFPVADGRTSPKTLPPKKRATRMSTSPPSFQDQPLSQQGSASSQECDVKVFPELMRTINHLKHKKKKEQGQDNLSLPTQKKEPHLEGSNMARASTIETRMEAAETLALFRQDSRPYPDYCHSSRMIDESSMQNFLQRPAFYNGHTSFDSRLNNLETNTYHMMNRYDYSRLVTNDGSIEDSHYKLPSQNGHNSLNRDVMNPHRNAYMVNHYDYCEAQDMRNASYSSRLQFTNDGSIEESHYMPPPQSGGVTDNSDARASQVNRYDYCKAQEIRNANYSSRLRLTNDCSIEESRYHERLIREMKNSDQHVRQMRLLDHFRAPSSLLHLKKDEDYLLSGLSQLRPDPRRMPISGLPARNSSAFNRAA